MNPIAILQNFIMKKMSPQQIINQIGVKNPMITNLMNMAKSGDSQSVENFARNMFKEKGRDFDKEFSEFMSNINQKS